jgi:integrase
MPRKKPPPSAALVPTSTSTSLANLAALTEKVQGFVEDSEAPNTRRAHESDWRLFQEWCRAHRMKPLPAAPETIAAYVASEAGRLKVSSLRRRLATISVAHQAAGFDSPTRTLLVRKTMAGIMRKHGAAPSKVTPILVDELRALSKALTSDDPVDLRDRALLLTMFACALRRSEAAALDVEDIEFTRKGYILTKRRSKTDQFGHGERIAVAYGDTESCPVIALRAWIKVAKLTSGALFRRVGVVKGRRATTPDGRLTVHAIYRIVKARVQLLGLDPEDFGGHSLRSGFATSAAHAGIEERQISKVTGHKDIKTMRGYIHEAELEAVALTKKVGL